MKPGTLFADRFELEELAGQGGTATVYRAKDRETGERVALKILQARRAAKRFARESRLLADLKHQHIVRYVHHGSADGRPYLAMEWLDGEDLAERLARGTLSVEQTLELAHATASALAKAHERGIVHRDLKPSNLFLVDGQPRDVKVLDFGVALEQRVPKGKQTGQGLALGTPTYMAPEQAQGERVDASADVFALGCVLFECVTGRHAFQADSVLALMTKVLLEEPPPLRELVPSAPAPLEDILVRMTSKRPEHRPADGRAVIEALESIRLDDHTVVQRPKILTTSERALVSVLVVGFRSIQEAAKVTMVDVAIPDLSFDDEETAMAEGVNVADPIGTIAKRYEGRREFLRDGSAVVLLTTSGAATEQAIRAARCGLELRALAMGAPVALATGLAQVGARAPVGRVIDRVSALLQGAGDAELRIDDVTARLLPPRFVTHGQLLLTEAEVELVDPPPTEMIGREVELRALEARLDEVRRSGTASVSVVVGEPGVGKSRLRRELLEHLEGPWQVGLGWGDPMRTSAPFGVLALALRELLGVPSSVPAEEQRSALLERVGEHVPAADVARIAAFLGEVLGAPFPNTTHPALQAARMDQRTMRSEAERAVWELLEACCRQRPVVLVVEDLHWCDLATIEVLDAALLFLANQPFALLGFGRPGLGDRLEGRWAGREEITLQSLPDTPARALATQMLGERADEERVQALVERSDGNPFFLEELARAVLSETSLERLPATVSAVVRSRLDRMPDDARRVMRAASILGERFDPDALGALLGRDPTAPTWLPALVDRGVLVHLESHGGAYAFQQGLLREAAYESLTENDRALGHRLAAEHLAERPNPDPLILAQHHERAGSPEAAAPYWLQAATAALDANAPIAALEHATRGLGAELEDGSALYLELQLRVARAARTLSDWSRAAEAAEAVLAGAEPMTEPWWEALRWAVLAYRTRGNLEESRRLVEMTRRSAEQTMLSFRSLASLLAIAQTAYLLEMSETGDALLRIADEHLPGGEAPNVPLRVERIEVLSQALLFEGDLGGYLDSQRERLALCAEAGLDYATAATHVNLGYVLISLGAFEDAEAELRRGLELGTVVGARSVVAAAWHNLGMCLMCLGRLDEALEHERRAAERYRKVGDARMLSACLGYLAAIHVARGELDEAEEATDRAMALAEPVAPGLVPYIAAQRARVRLRRGDSEGALALIEPIVREVDEGASIEEGETLLRLTLAEIYDAQGRRDDARGLVANARERLLAKADRIRDPGYRTSYLERVRENARTLALHHAWNT